MEQEHRRVSFETAKRIMDTQPDCLVLDVRDEEEYITGHAEGALLFPLHTINAQTAAETIPSLDTPVLVYCRSGRRSYQAARKLMELGYTKVGDIGSLVGWPYGLTV